MSVLVIDFPWEDAVAYCGECSSRQNNVNVRRCAPAVEPWMGCGVEFDQVTTRAVSDEWKAWVAAERPDLEFIENPGYA